MNWFVVAVGLIFIAAFSLIVMGLILRLGTETKQMMGTHLMAAGALVGYWMKMYPIDAAIVNACHSGQGGTGDVAILTAANRMTLMPFAQIATRIGGAITVTTVLIVLSHVT